MFYDFSCGFHQYVLNREPNFFGKMEAWIYQFHFADHNSLTSCSQAFNPSRVAFLSGINDSVAEQYHSFIESIRHHVSNMSQVSFMFIYQYSMRIWNRVKEKARALAKEQKAYREGFVDSE